MPQLDVDIIHLKLQYEQEKRKVINKGELCQIFSSLLFDLTLQKSIDVLNT